MAVPFIDLSRSVSPVREKVLADWSACLAETAFVLGERVTRFETAVSQHLGTEPMVACANGTDALRIALATVGVGPGHRVALPNLTFWATYEAVAQLGATPVLFDVDEADLHLDWRALRDAHARERLDAVLLVHLFGWCAERTDAIRAFCREEAIPLVEDAAQAFGVELDGVPLLHDAEVATMSFYPAKVLGGSADGGGMFFRDPELAVRARKLTNHGRESHYTYSLVGWNSRMSSPNAAFLSRMLEEIDGRIAARRRMLVRYRAAITALGDPRVRLWDAPPGVTPNGYLAVITVDGVEGDALAEGLRARDIGCARTYPETIDMQPPAAKAERVGDLAVSRAFCRRVVNLPLFFGISEAECDEAIDALAHTLAAR